MKPSQVGALIDDLCKLPSSENDPIPAVMLQGPPGNGKTSVCRQAAARNKCYLLAPNKQGVLHPIMYEPPDLIGIPSVRDGKTYQNPLSWTLDQAPPGFSRLAIIIDELSQADQSMQKACAPILEERRIGNVVLPPSTLIMATGNRIEDRAGAHKILSHVRSRYVKIDFQSDLEDFESWGMETGLIVPEVRYFLRFKPAMLNTFKPDREGQYACQRGWQKVSHLYPHLRPELRGETIQGTVGDGEGSEFMAFAQIWEKMARDFDPAVLLKDPAKAALPSRSEPGVLWAVTGSVAEYTKNRFIDSKNGDGAKALQAGFTYMKRLPKEYYMLGGNLTYRMLPRDRISEVIGASGYQDWFRDHKDVLQEARKEK